MRRRGLQASPFVCAFAQEYNVLDVPLAPKARAMQHWIDRSGIAQRPMPVPYNGPQLGVGDLTTLRPGVLPSK